MKKLANTLIITLALNFLVVLGGAGWLASSGHLDRKKLGDIRAILFPASDAQPATQPSQPQPTTRPSDRLEALLARHAGLPITAQVDVIRESFDAQSAMLDRRQRELSDLERQLELAKQQLAKDRVALDARGKQLENQARQAQQLASDKGFQDSLELYRTMPAKQVKTIFMTLDDRTVVQYLQAMDGRVAAKITKEYRTPDEIERLKKIMELMRQQQASSQG